MGNVYALIEEEEGRHKFSLYGNEPDAQRAGAYRVTEGLKEGGFAGVDVAPILEALADGNWTKAIETYNALGLKEQLRDRRGSGRERGGAVRERAAGATRSPTLSESELNKEARRAALLS